ncbi:MAG: DUF167 domain-containing protein [Candidatus Saccharibacteria bacterium]
MIVEVNVKPGSKKGPLIQPGLDGSLLVFVSEPAIDGKANQAVVKLLSKYYEVSKSKVQIVSGLTSKNKRFLITKE